MRTHRFDLNSQGVGPSEGRGLSAVLWVLLMAALVAGCASDGSSSSPKPKPSDMADADTAPVTRGPSFGDERQVDARSLTPKDRADFANAWRQFVQERPAWPVMRNEWLSRGGAAPYVLSEALFRHFFVASMQKSRQRAMQYEIERVGEEAAIVGEPAVAYFAKCLAVDSWPLSRQTTLEVADPEYLDGRIQKTFDRFEMDDETRRDAARVLARIGEPAVATLASDRILRASRPTSRRYGAYALGRIGSPRAIAALGRMLTTASDWQDRGAAASALGEALMRGPEARAHLEAARTRESDEFVRRKIDDALSGRTTLRF